MTDTEARRRRDLKGDARRERILELLHTRSGGDFTVEELSERMNVSVATVRRDLTRMRELGTIARTYGGVTLIPNAEVPSRDRRTAHRAAKEAIGARAAELVDDDDLIVIDAGTTTACMAPHLSHRSALTVVTNGIGVINGLLEHPGPDVIVLGGQLRGINETIVGAEAQDMLSRVHASRAFIGTDAIDPQRGIASRTFAQSLLKSQMMSGATEIIILADSSKLVDDDFRYWSPLTRAWTLITDSNADDAALSRARSAGAETIHVVEAPDFDTSTEKEL